MIRCFTEIDKTQGIRLLIFLAGDNTLRWKNVTDISYLGIRRTSSACCRLKLDSAYSARSIRSELQSYEEPHPYVCSFN
jgi:hypothetical protein